MTTVTVMATRPVYTPYQLDVLVIMDYRLTTPSCARLR